MTIAYKRILKILNQTRKSSERILRTYKQNDNKHEINSVLFAIDQRRLKDIKNIITIIERDRTAKRFER